MYGDISFCIFTISFLWTIVIRLLTTYWYKFVFFYPTQLLLFLNQPSGDFKSDLHTI